MQTLTAALDRKLLFTRHHCPRVPELVTRATAFPGRVQCARPGRTRVLSPARVGTAGNPTASHGFMGSDSIPEARGHTTVSQGQGVIVWAGFRIKKQKGKQCVRCLSCEAGGAWALEGERRGALDPAVPTHGVGFCKEGQHGSDH